MMPPILKQTDVDSNTCRMVIPRAFREQQDWVRAVSVTDREEAYKGNIRVYWEIHAKERVSMHGFQVEVGRVPEGFEQTVPEGGAKFTPVAGKLYNIAVSLEVYPGSEWIGDSFKAGKPEAQQ